MLKGFSDDMYELTSRKDRKMRGTLKEEIETKRGSRSLMLTDNPLLAASLQPYSFLKFPFIYSLACFIRRQEEERKKEFFVLSFSFFFVYTIYTLCFCP